MRYQVAIEGEDVTIVGVDKISDGGEFFEFYDKKNDVIAIVSKSKCSIIMRVSQD